MWVNEGARIFSLLAALFIGAGTLFAQSAPQEIGRVKQPIDDKPQRTKNPQPKPEQKRPSRWGEPTEVRIGLYVIDVDGVNSANQNFSASVYIQARWNVPSLRHDGPAPLIRRTTQVWTPRLVIVNQQQAWSAFPSFVEILPDGEVVYRQKTWGWFSQPLALEEFPFDRQKLSIHLVAAGLKQAQVKMVPLNEAGRGKSGIAKKFSMPDFQITNWKAEQRPYIAFEDQTAAAGFIMEIEIKRLPMYYFLKVIFPLCLIVIMSTVPRWLDPKESGTSIGISTTAFLTLVAYLFAITHILPKVPYLTRMDEFILLSTLLVFVGLLHTVLSTYMINVGREASVGYFNRLSRVIYPTLLLAVLAVSFA